MAACCFATMNAQADETAIVKDGIKYTLDTSKSTAMVSGYDTSEGSGFPSNGVVNIPETVTDSEGVSYSVTSLAEKCFYNCTSLVEITIPDGIGSLGYGCFYSCTSLVKINLPDSVASLGMLCFYACISLENISLPDKLISLGDRCFLACRSLTSITIPSSVKSIGDACFCTVIDEAYALTLKEVIFQGNEITECGNTIFDVPSECKFIFEDKVPSALSSETTITDSNTYYRVKFVDDANNVLQQNDILKTDCPYEGITAPSSVQPSSITGNKFSAWSSDNYKKITDSGVTISAVYEAISLSDERINASAEPQSYTGSKIEPAINVTFKKDSASELFELVEKKDYTITTYGENINIGAGSGTVTIEGMGNFSGQRVIVFDIIGIDISRVAATDINNQAYTGSDITPEPVIKDEIRGVTLVKDRDYELSYINNINVGVATITINAVKDSFYTGTKDVNFTISPKILELDWDSEKSFVFDGQAHVPNANVSGYAQGDNATLTVSGEQIDVGEYTATAVLTGNDNYALPQDSNCKFTITAKNLNPDVALSEVKDEVYSGAAITPSLTVTDNVRKVELVKDADYTLVNVGDNVNVGPCAFAVIGKGNYTGEIFRSFKITPAQLNLIWGEVTLTYTGLSQAPKATVNNIIGSDEVIVNVEGAQTEVGIYSATVQLSGKSIGNYSLADEAKSSNFSIVAAPISTASIAEIPDQQYDGTIKTPEPVITNPNTNVGLVKGKDYTLNYSNNTKSGTATITISAIEGSNWTGETTATFRIGSSINIDNITVYPVDDADYSGLAYTPEPRVTIKDDNGNETDLKKYNPETKEGSYSLVYPEDSTNVGVKVAQVKGEGGYADAKTFTFNINAISIDNDKVTAEEIPDVGYTGSQITPTPIISYNPNEATSIPLSAGFDYDLDYGQNIEIGQGSITITAREGSNWTVGTTKTFTFNIVDASTSLDTSIVEEIVNQTYTGKVIEPTIVVKMDDAPLVKGQDYSVEYKDNINVGMATVIVRGMGNYTGINYGSFDIIAASIMNASIAHIPDQTYDGTAKTPELAITNPNTDTLLEKDVDYTLAYSANVTPGIVEVTITGINNWQGETTETFNIVDGEPSPEVKDIATATVTGIETSYVETGSAIVPVPVVTDKTVNPTVVLIAGTDYDVSYANNVAVGTATVSITGKGNWTGSKKISFQITASPTPTPVPTEASWNRLAGGTALSTMQKIVNAGWETSDYAIVATSQGYQDALSASALAGLLGNAPVLLTKSNELSSQTSKLLTSKSVKNVIIVGGTGAVSDGVESAIAALGCTVERIAGGTATTTATAVYKWGTDASKTGGTVWGKDAIVATLDSFQDALSIAPYAYAKHAPIFLTDKGTKDIRSSVQKYISEGGFDRTLIVGGTGAVSESVGGKVVSPNRLYGGTAYTTSKAIANFALSEGMTATNMGVACGTTYQDALVGASFLGKLGSIIALADEKNSTTVNSVVAKNKDSLGKCYIFGGTSAVSQTVEDKLNLAIK